MKHTIKGYVTYEKSEFATKPTISFYTFKPNATYFPGIAIVREQSIEVDVPDDFDPRPDLIKGLKEKERKARADFQATLTEIQRRISELEAIEYTPA